MAYSIEHFVYLGFSSMTEHLLALNEISKNANFTLLRAGQTHNDLTLQLWSAKAKATLPLSTTPQDSCWIEKPNKKFLDAYFRQSRASVNKNLLVLETEKLSELLICSHKLVLHDFDLIDIERASGYRKTAVAYLANGTASQAKENLDTTAIRFHLIEDPSTTTLSLFNNF